MIIKNKQIKSITLFVLGGAVIFGGLLYGFFMESGENKDAVNENENQIKEEHFQKEAANTHDNVEKNLHVKVKGEKRNGEKDKKDNVNENNQKEVNVEKNKDKELENKKETDVGVDGELETKETSLDKYEKEYSDKIMSDVYSKTTYISTFLGGGNHSIDSWKGQTTDNFYERLEDGKYSEMLFNDIILGFDIVPVDSDYKGIVTGVNIQTKSGSILYEFDFDVVDDEVLLNDLKIVWSY